jgi:SAM-dependent methyltransferase
MLYFELTKDKVYNIKTTFITKQGENKDNFHYQGASYFILDQLFEQLYKAYSNYKVIDIGCGKGRALFVAEHKGFNQLQGIDVDTTLVNLAIENSSTYKFKRDESSFIFLEQDALKLSILNEACIYYLFNPFSDVVMKPFLQHLILNSKKDFILVYLNPKYETCLQEAGLILKQTIYTGSYKEAVIYSLGNNKSDKV